MADDVAHYPRYRFPPAIISHAVWLYYRFTLSFRDVEDLLAQRGITVSYESIRHWCEAFGLAYARRLRRRAGPVGDTWPLDELFVTIRGQRQYLWRAIDQDGDVIDILSLPETPSLGKAPARACFKVADTPLQNLKCEVRHLSAYNRPALPASTVR
jgi:transposase-like protein